MMSINKDWKKDMQEEIDFLLENKTWELVNISKGIESLQNKWVYKLKHECEGRKEWYKTRLVAK